MTKARSIRVDDGLWELWRKESAELGIDVTKLIIRRMCVPESTDTVSKAKKKADEIREPKGQKTPAATHPFCQIGRHDSFLSDDGVICKRCGVKL